VAKAKGKPNEQSASDLGGVLGGMLNVLGVKIDLGQLLSSPEDLTGQLGALRQKLKEAGGKATLSDEEWRAGGATVTGYIRTRGLLGDQEFHIGTAGRRESGGDARRGATTPEATEVVEPVTDVFDEAGEVTLIANVPGVALDDLTVTVNDGVVTIATKPSARRGYRKELRLESELDPGSLRASCNNGVLEVHVRKRVANG